MKRAGLICQTPEDVTCLIPAGRKAETTTSTAIPLVVAKMVQDIKNRKPPADMASLYLLGRRGANLCPAGSKRIENEAECRVAVAALGMDWERKLGSSIDPKGCLIYGSKGFYNTHPDGADAEDPSLVCRKAESNEWCSKGIRKGEVCCAASCNVCGGPTCEGNCCGGNIKQTGSVCRAAEDVSCLIPPGQPEPLQEASERLCRLGMRNGEACCASSCKVCGGPLCAGSCCGGYMKRAGRYCERPEDVTCLIPQ